MDNPFAPALLIDEQGPVRIVTINRPEVKNAVDPAVHRGLANVWKHLARRRDARAVVVTGAGDAFSAGGDVPPQALQSTKRAVNLHIRRASTAVLDYALAAEHRSFDTPEHRAIVAKFLKD